MLILLIWYLSLPAKWNTFIFYLMMDMNKFEKKDTLINASWT